MNRREKESLNKHTSLGGPKVGKVPDELSNEIFVHGPVKDLMVLFQEGDLEIFCELKKQENMTIDRE